MLQIPTPCPKYPAALLVLCGALVALCGALLALCGHITTRAHSFALVDISKVPKRVHVTAAVPAAVLMRLFE